MKNLVSHKLLALLLLLSPLFLMTACDGGQVEPDDTVRAFFKALQEEEYADAFAQFSSRQKDAIREELTKISEAEDTAALAWLNKQFGTSFERSDVANLSPEEFYELALKSAHENSSALREGLSGDFSVEQPRMLSDDRASVRVVFANGESEEYTCRREAGAWRLDFAP